MAYGLHIRPSMIIGTIVLLIAVITLLGWVTHTPALVQSLGGPAMVFNTALCFVLLALAVMLDKPESPQKSRLQQGLGGLVILIAGAVLSQHLSGINIGLDWPSLHRWLETDNPHPGRMSRPTALAFMLCGTVLLLMHRVRSLRQGLLVQALTVMPAFIAVMVLAGLLLELRLVYADYLLAQMAALTAAGFIGISVALWLCWRKTAWYRSRSILKNEGQRIGLIGALTLAVVTSFAVLAGFSTAQREIEATISDGLLQTLKNNTNIVMFNIDQRIGRATTISSRPRAVEYLLTLKARDDDREATIRLAELAGSFLPLGFSGIAFFDDSGRELLRTGRFTEQPEWSVRLDLPHAPLLLWSDGGPVLSTRLPILRDGQVVGTVLAEQPMPALSRALSDIETLGQTSELGICKVQDAMFHCIQQRFMPKVYRIPYSETLPMSRAVAGETGIMLTRDYRRQNVIAAHGPIGGPGLGMVVKVDTVELYAPVREYLNIALPLSLLLGAGGGLFLYARLKPLVGEIERSREIVREQGARALQFSEDRLSSIVSSAKDAIISIDERRCVLIFNAAAEQMFQYASSKIIGRPFDMLVPLRVRAEYEQLIRDFAASGPAAQSINKSGIFFGLRADGEEFPVETSISKTGTPPDQLFTVILRDITRRLQTERLIAGQKNLLEGIAVGLPLPHTLNEICRLGESGNKDLLCSILLLETDGLRLRHGAAPSLPAEFIRAIDGLAIGPAAGSCGTAVFRQTPVVVEDIAADPLWNDYRALALAHGLRACWATPIFDEQQHVLGTFAIYARQPRKPLPQENRAIEAATQIATIAIQRDRTTRNLREVSQRLLIVEEAERRAISHELHDRIGQDLSAINLNIDLMRMQLPVEVQKILQTRLNDIQDLTRSSINNARDIMADLHPVGLENAGLRVALQHHAKRISQRLQLAITVDGSWSGARLAPSVELALFRIAQEAINNIAKHAAAANIHITLAEISNTNLLTLGIADDGRGFDVAAISVKSYGLRTMRERAQAINAELQIDSAPGKGAHIIVTLTGALS